MKTQKWWLSWCAFLFTTANDFWRRLEPSHRTIVGWVFVKWSYFLKHCCNYLFQVFLLSISKKEKDEYDFHTGWSFSQILAESCSWKGLILSLITSLLVVIYISKIFDSVQNLDPLWRASRGVFRTQLNIYDGVFLQK